MLAYPYNQPNMTHYSPGYDQQDGYAGQRFGGYLQFGDEMQFLRARYQQLYNLHLPRIHQTEKNLALYMSAEEAIYGTARRRDDEDRPMSSKPHRIVEMYCGLVLNKPPTINVASVEPSPIYNKTAGDVEADITAIADRWGWWRGVGRAYFWAAVGGAGLYEGWYNQMAMDDEALLVVSSIDPRLSVWKESVTQDGSLDYIFTKVETPLHDIKARWNTPTLGQTYLDRLLMTDPMHKVNVYTYWAVERARVDGRPVRAVINAVFTDYGFLREPTIMTGYTHIPINLVRRVDIPLEHIRMDRAYEGVLTPTYDEIVQEIRFLAALLNNAKDHINPAYLATSNDPSILQRVQPHRGGLYNIHMDEKVEPMQKATTQTPDVQAVMNALNENIDGSTISKMFQGGVDLKEISGVTASISSTGPLIRFAKSQQLLEDSLQVAIPAFLACLARHALSDGREIRVVGRNPQQQQGFHMAVLDQNNMLMLDGDIRVIVKLSSSLPRDAINEVMTLDGLARSGKLSNRTVRQHALRLFDIYGTNPEAEEQQIWMEKLQQLQFDFYSQQGPVAPPSLEGEYIPPGFQRGPGGMMQQDPMHQMGPEEPLMSGPMVERQPGPRYGPAVHDQLSGRGNEVTGNPSLHRQRAGQALDRFGAMVQPNPRRRT